MLGSSDYQHLHGSEETPTKYIQTLIINSRLKFLKVVEFGKTTTFTLYFSTNLLALFGTDDVM